MSCKFKGSIVPVAGDHLENFKTYPRERIRAGIARR
jgi:hypothetical protein